MCYLVTHLRMQICQYKYINSRIASHTQNTQGGFKINYNTCTIMQIG